MKVFVALTVLGVIGAATALQCFNCNSETDSACNDDFDFDSPALNSAFAQTCEEADGAQPFCRKVKYYIHNNTLARVQRDCGYKKREGYDCYQKRSEDYIMDTCQCTEELCNGAPSFTTSFATMFAVTVPFLARYL